MTLSDPARAEALALTEQLAAAWDRGDAVAYAQWFTEDSQYIAFDGTRHDGRAANVAIHKALFDSVLKGSRMRFTRVDGAELGPDVRILYTEGAVLLPFQREITGSRKSIQTFVLVRRPEGWRVASFHNTRMRPVSVPQGLQLKLIQLVFWVLVTLRGPARAAGAAAPAARG
jgi:uncharacterized protein (TIGR02246 family)